ncbi:MAG TPA: DUF4192 domain-containing protein [Aeromicrobium sp.]|nr:DUF4192 domain-containing protein [Aeromicrobium sp.]
MTRRSVFKAGNLGELINALPALFGFPPENSLIALGTHGTRIVFGMRLDLADVGAPDDVDRTADLAVRHLQHQRVDGAIVIAVGEPLELGRRLVLAIESRLSDVRPVAGGWATDERCWVSMAGGDPRGYSYRRSLHHPAAAQAVMEGREIAPSRAAVVASIEPVAGERRARIETDAEAVVSSSDVDFDHLTEPHLSDLMTEVVLPVLHDLRDGEPVDDWAVLRLGHLLTAIAVRDQAWQLVTHQNAREFVRVWLHVARNVPLAWAPPAYSLAAFSAWMFGDGAKVLMAAEQALQIDPGYSMARLMVELAMSGAAPRGWAWTEAAKRG